MIAFILENISEFFRRRDLLALFLTAVVIRLAYFLLMLVQISPDQIMSLIPDTVGYVYDARELLLGHIRLEGAVIIFGPGYVVFLALIFFVTGVGPWIILPLQILLSGFSCLIVYRLGRELTGSKTVGYIAGYLLALSFTSVSLSTLVLSDTLFLFLFIWGNLAFLRGLKNLRMSYIIWAGVLIGIAALVRSIGQFWPLAMIAIPIIARYDGAFPRISVSRPRYFLRAMPAPLIAIVIMLIWVGRNYIAYDIPMLAFTGAGGPANVAALTLARLENKEKGGIMIGWEKQYQQKTGKQNLTQLDRYHVYATGARETFAAYPWEMLKTYRHLVWQNMNESNELVRVQMPNYQWRFLNKMYWLRSHSLHLLPFWITIAGFLLMLVTGRWRATVFLGLYYVYIASMMGFTEWQGSRLFFPAQGASLIASAYTLVMLWRGIRTIFDRLGVFPARLSVFPFAGLRIKDRLSQLRRYYFVFFCLILIAGIVILYRHFFHNGMMLRSGDMIGAGIFFRTFLVDHIRTFGSIPQWNPYILCGLPYVGPIHGDIFYPLSFLKFLMAVPRAIGWTFILHIFLAGIFAYLAARQFGLSRLAATVAGLAYAFSGWLNSLVLPGHDSKIYVTALFPLVILFIDRSFSRRPFFQTTAAAVVIGAIILSPHPQMAYFTFWAAAGYFAYRSILVISEKEHKLRFAVNRTAQVVYMVILAMMIGAIQFLPSYDYVRHYSPRTMTYSKYSFATAWSLHQEELVSLIVPEFCGANTNPGDNLYWGRNGTKDNSEYAGLVALILAIIGIIHYHDRRRYFFGIVAVGAVLYGLADTTPLFHFLYRNVPFVRYTRAPSMIMFLFSFSVAMLAGMGMDAVRAGRGDGSNKKLRGLTVVSILFPILLGIGAFLFAAAGAETLRLYAALFYRQLFDSPEKLAAATANLPVIRSGFIVAFILATLTAIFLWLGARLRWGMIFLLAIPVLIMIDGIRFDRQFIKTDDYRKEFRLWPMAEFIRNHAGNNRAFGYALNEIGFHLYYQGISSPMGYHGNELVTYYRFLYYPPGLASNFINPRFDDLIGVKYIITPANADLSPVGHDTSNTKTVFSSDGFDVVENLGRFPRAFLVGKYRIIPAIDTIFHQVYSGSDDLRQTALVTDEPGSPIDGTFSPGDTADLTYYSPDSVVISAACRTPKLLVLSDNYYKDWHAYIDGSEAEPEVVYATFRGVVLPPGQHQVVWKIIPASYYVGKTFTFAALFYLAGLSIATPFIRRKKREYR